ncbi:MAG: T9SS type A sorting domain-containing protein, partial [Candidatus Eisenbacteria bacterium]|nr:T9SS type A sorting domain-containing protein [Candidatus Eisenbacteria bacterium]
SGLRPGETGSGFSGADFERVLDDPMFDTTGPDLVALDVARSSTELAFRLVFEDPLSEDPPYAFISLDTDRDPSTGTHPPAQGYGLATQDVGAEFEIVIENYCGNFVSLLDAVTGEYLNGYFLEAGERTIGFTVPLSDLRNDDGIMNVSVSSLPGYCDGGSRRPVPVRSAGAAADGAIRAMGTTSDWMPEVGHGTIGSCAWLSITPREAEVAPGDSVILAVCVDARALTDTTLGCSVGLLNNDPRTPQAVLTVDLMVTATTDTPIPETPADRPAFALRQNDPNPFVESTRIRFSLPEAGRVRLSIFDSSGRLVREVVDETRPAGPHEIELRPGRLAGGIYWYRLESGSREATRKMVILR